MHFRTLDRDDRRPRSRATDARIKVSFGDNGAGSADIRHSSAGENMSFPFAPDEKLNVYTGDFKINVVVRPLHNVVPTKYAFRGNLKYQACDKAACYPPKLLPVNFEVKVTKGVSTTRRNPAQSPHVHR